MEKEVKENTYKGRRFELCTGMNGQPVNYTGLVAESWKDICLVEEQRQRGQSGFFSICVVKRDILENKDILQKLFLDFNTDSRSDSPIQESASKTIVKAKFDQVIKKQIEKEKAAALAKIKQAEAAESAEMAARKRSIKMTDLHEIRRGLIIELRRLFNESEKGTDYIKSKRAQEIAKELQLLNITLNCYKVTF